MCSSYNLGVSLRVGLSVPSPRLLVPRVCGLSTAIPHANGFKRSERNIFF